MNKILVNTISTVIIASASFTLQAETSKPANLERNYDAESKAYLIKARKAARAGRYFGLLNSVCFNPIKRIQSAPKNIPHRTISDPSKIPATKVWDGEPAQIFDNLYFVGGKEHSAWILQDEAGLILIDTIYPYNSKALIVEGMKQLDLDPMDIKYIVISHGHSDHIGGVEIMQKASSNAPVVMGKADWQLTELYPKRYTNMMPNPNNGIRVTERFNLTVGQTTIDVIPTPGHTKGTLGFIFQVTDFGRPITVAYNGGTSPSFPTKEPSYGMPNLQEYINSTTALASAAKEAGATVLLTNHSIFDNAYEKSRAIKLRGYGPHPFETGEKDVANYFSTIENCAKMMYTQLEKKQASAKLAAN